MDAYVYEFGQLYDGLLRLHPELASPKTQQRIYQFLAMAMAPDWSMTGERSALVDLSSPTRDGFFNVGARRVSQAYRDLLYSLDPVAGVALIPEVARAMGQSDFGCVRVACDMEEDIRRWGELPEPALKIEVNSAIPCENDWTALYSGQSATGFSTILNGPCRYTFSAQGLGVYDIQRGDWYQERFVSPTFPIVEGGGLTREDFFGKGGALQHVSRRVVVVWKPQVVLTLSREALPLFLQGANALGTDSPPMRLLGLDFDFMQAQVLPAANGPDDDSVSLLLPGIESLQLWGIQSGTHYM